MNETFQEYEIYTEEIKKDDYHYILWKCFKNGVFILQDYNTLEGEFIKSHKQAIVEAKRNIKKWKELSY